MIRFLVIQFLRDVNKSQIRSLSSNKNNTTNGSRNFKPIRNSLEKSRTVVIGKVGKNEKLELLQKNAEQFQSTAPNEKGTINKIISKPKTYIRSSARPVQEKKIKIINDDIKLNNKLNKRLIEAARQIADRMPKHLAQETEKQLLNSIEEQKRKEILETKEKNTEKKTISDYWKSELKKAPFLFTDERLSIFNPKRIYMNNSANRNIFWEKLCEKELEQSAYFLHENFFEEMIQWTEEGKLWKFPIDNEQDLEEEKDVPFYDHVLLDNLLDGIPEKGPIRYFMEVLLIGLSHNPYITVERKRDTIKFYKDFFKDKTLIEVNE